ncbi:HNH endonuclease [Aphanothece hegewaldii CCALA 016]|uniref:HNH endonuclease n=1 Tax=Aphanothece hegewaldii CCALA 016 TaxID=2107694 RepID=A0A2T1LRF3_9CHRO|nr:HNH endonuclease signature motif containing protein [Aphanothece hegewaldii]PSF31275.1 HNH endonuclease [Aphanothece hegewaldii CCALA 016]
MSTYIAEEVKARVRRDAKEQCGYCRSLQKYVLGILEIEHIIPKALNGTDDEENLWLACRLCNSYKGIQTQAEDPLTKTTVSLFNPRQQKWVDHFIWTEDGAYIEGITPVGRATVKALQLNNQIAVAVRKAWVSAGWHPPVEN